MTTRISKETMAAIEKAWPDIIDRFADGESLKAICADYPFTRSSVIAFRRIMGGQYQIEYDEARRDSADSAIDDITDTISSQELDHRYARNKLNALMWIAEKRNPDQYAQRVRQDINVQKVDLNKILADANQRLTAYEHSRLEHAARADLSTLTDVTTAVQGAGRSKKR